MEEGLDADDRYRMVEDEFMEIAKKFTVHLHAAEYKRQQKMVKSRNAETINSISRPVMGKMPDATKRKVEAIARAKTQRAALEGLLGKKKDGGLSDDGDEGEVLPYFGTSLHGLMDSPRRKATTITKPGAIHVATRAAAGFQRPASQSEFSRPSTSGSPKPKSMAKVKSTAQRQEPAEQETSSDNDDDDLDAPILAPKLPPLKRKASPAAIPSDVYQQEVSLKGSPLAPASKPAASTITIKQELIVAPIEQESSLNFDDVPPFLSSQVGPHMSRLERARQLKAKQEKEKQAKNKLGDIPAFF